MAKEMTHRDEIHGDLSYDRLAVALLDMPGMQRLGRVYQLGYAHLVYRGGNHSRLSHVMGSYGTAARLVTALQHNYARRTPPKGAESPDVFLPALTGPSTGLQAAEPQMSLEVPAERRDASLGQRWEVLRYLVSWAALLHDLAHIPWGHTLEDEFSEFYEKHDSLASPRLLRLWSTTEEGGKSDVRRVFERTDLYPDEFKALGMTKAEDVWGAVLLICLFNERLDKPQDQSFEAKLARLAAEGNALATELVEIHQRLRGALFHPYMTDIVANTISADYLDYLRRDPHNLGLDVLRDDRVASRFWIGRDSSPGRQLRMALSLEDGRGKPRLDTCTGVVDLVRQRYRFAEIVYYHKTKISASTMLAKAFQLMGRPSDEVLSRVPLEVEAAEREVASILEESDPSKALESVRRAALPVSLLDPEIGDEAVPLWLLHQAWDRFSTAVEGRDNETAVKMYQAIAMLQALVRRRLYKVVMTIDRDQYGDLEGKASFDEDQLEPHLAAFITSLKQPARREEVERAMATAAGWAQNSILLYVPPRKSQAKGIETGALQDGTVVSLGSHRHVKAQVEELGKRYQELWKLVVLVHPSRSEEVVPLSNAADAFAKEVFNREGNEETISVLTRASWFTYVRRKDREKAAEHLRILDASPRWELLARWDAIVSNSTPEERAEGATIYRLLLNEHGDDLARKIIEAHFRTAGDLTGLIEDHISKRPGLKTASSEGQTPEEKKLWHRRKAIELIASGLKIGS